MVVELMGMVAFLLFVGDLGACAVVTLCVGVVLRHGAEINEK